MSILALDACGRYAIAALRRGTEAPPYAVSDAGVGAVRAVYSSVDRVLEKGGATPADLTAIVVNTGPGSWTGVRIAATYAASFAFGAGAPVYGFSGFAIGKRMASGVAFIDQLGKTIAEEGAAEADMAVNLFPEMSADEYLAGRAAWLDEMLKLGAESLAAGADGDPLALQTTYFQEFLTGART